MIAKVRCDVMNQILNVPCPLQQYCAGSNESMKGDPFGLMRCTVFKMTRQLTLTNGSNVGAISDAPYLTDLFALSSEWIEIMVPCRPPYMDASYEKSQWTQPRWLHNFAMLFVMDSPPMVLTASFSKRLFEPVDAASIYAFRLMFGLVMFWEVWRFVGSDWIGEYYVDRPFLFKYYGFSWVKAWPGDGMYIHFAVVGVLALCMAFGFLYRSAAWLFFLGFSYWFLLDQTRYLNHLYLVCLISFLLACIPANRGLSLDARLRSGLMSQTLPAWCLWVLRFQVCVVYFYAGIAKLNVDWLRLEPIRTWLARRNDYPLIGPFLETEVAAAFFGYGGLVFDLTIAPLLLWKRTRVWAFVVCIFFHATNKMLFNIGIFPFLAIALTTVMLSPDWPRRLKLFVKQYPANSPSRAVAAPTGFVRGMVVAFLTIYISIQLLFPLRHFLYPGYVSWTEEGHRFAWHMKLREKRAMARFFATDPRTGETQEVDTTQWLCKEQRKRVGRFSDMSLQFAHFLADELGEGDGRLEIRVQSIARVNGRMSQLIFDPNVDLAAEKRSLAHAEWILPLRYDLPAVD